MQKQLVIIGNVFPEPNSTAAGKRMLQLIDFFQKDDYSIIFLSTASASEHSFDLSSKNIKTQQIILNDSSFDVIIKNINPDAVLFDRFMTEEQFGWRVSEICPNTLRILDTEDLHFLRKARETAYKQNIPLQQIDLINDIFKREIASILRCDLSLIISEFEFLLLTEHFKINKNLVFYLPIFGEPKPGSSGFYDRKNFVSIGNFLHEPNWQTVLKLKKIWPAIHKKNPTAELHIYGAYAPEKALQLHNEKEKFYIKGRAESVEKIFYSSRVLLAPIPFGAGIKGKLLESMVYGLPSVTTSIGAESMHSDLPWNGYICDTDTDFVEKAITLYQEKTTWENSQKNGFEILEQIFKEEKHTPALSQKLTSIMENTDEHRNSNFLGKILQHHTLQSTKYMSKWIEEKNKK